MKTLIIDNKNWQLGTSTDDESDFAGVAGLSPDRKGQNYFRSKGDSLAGQPSLVVMTGSSFQGPVIAGLVDPTTTSRDAIIVATNGKFYSTSGSVITLFAEDSTHNTEYRKGKTDLKYYKGSFYATREQDIIKIESNLVTIDFVWWHTTKGKTALSPNGPHPIEIVEDTMYIADIEKIHTWDGTTAVEAQFSLPTGYTITALKVHTDGRYLKVFATDTFNYWHTDKVTSKMFLLDTVSLEWTNSYDIDEQVEGAINWGGTCFCTYGDNFGYFDGSGLKLIRKIALSGDSEVPLYSPMLSIFSGAIMFPSNYFLNAYGDVSGKGSIFFFPFTLVSSSFSHFILPISNTLCLISYSDQAGVYRLGQLDFSLSPEMDAQTTKIDLGGPVWVRKVTLFMDQMPLNSYLSIYNRQDDGSAAEVGYITRSEDGAITQKRMDCNILADFIQPFITGGAAPLIKKIHIQYESAE